MLFICYTFSLIREGGTDSFLSFLAVELILLLFSKCVQKQKRMFSQDLLTLVPSPQIPLYLSYWGSSLSSLYLMQDLILEGIVADTVKCL